ncbi:hypothetical protein BSKO_06282 [Bryopsis sp. KO-2023]|nr:hypothetical protein BSKO_06282 [Bryopsis sp. KO-2023]
MFASGRYSAGHSPFSSRSLDHRHTPLHGGGRRRTLATPRATSNPPTPESLLKRFQEGAEGDDSATLPTEPTNEPEKTPFPAPDSGRVNKLGLEFFNERDFAEMNDVPLRTARPEPEEGVLRAFEVESYIETKFAELYKQQKDRMVKTGEVTPAQMQELEKEMGKNVKKQVDPISDDLLAAKGTVIDPNDPRPENMSVVEELMYDWHIPEFVWFEEGEGGLPVVRMAHPNGEEIKIHLQGACITSWKRADRKEALLVRPDAVFKKGERINSGLSLAFPQYDAGLLPFDGFAGNLMWEVVNSEVSPFWVTDPAPSVTLRCCDTEETRKYYPHKFEFFYKITLGEDDDPPSTVQDPAEVRKQVANELRQLGLAVPEELRTPPPKEKEPYNRRRKRGKRGKEEPVVEEEEQPPNAPTQLKLQFTVKNLGGKTMEFLCATKPHFRVSDLCEHDALVRAVGLGGKPHLDYTLTEGRPRLRSLNNDYLYFGAGGLGVHSIFMRCEIGDLFFCPGTLAHYEIINRAGFSDVIAIQPGDQPDKLHWSRFLAVLGRGKVSNAVRLQPEEEWYGETVIRFHEGYFEEPSFGYQEDIPPSTFPEHLRKQDEDL